MTVRAQPPWCRGNATAVPATSKTASTQNPFSTLWKVTRSTKPPRTSVAVLVLAGCPPGDLILAPHATHASRDIDPYALARVPCRQASGNTRPGGSFKEAEQLVWNKAGA
jgi:hypothetical protein